jgi:hypothetical protein
LNIGLTAHDIDWTAIFILHVMLHRKTKPSQLILMLLKHGQLGSVKFTPGVFENPRWQSHFLAFCEADEVKEISLFNW